jgi:hypothetical protein
MGNTWPGGKRHAMSQSDHEEWNSRNYPGTREICCECNQPTGNCGEDSHFDNDGDPYCYECATRAGIIDDAGE